MTVGQIVDGWLLVECLRARGHSGAVYRVIRDGCPSLAGVLKVHTVACKVSRRMFRHEDLFVAAQTIRSYLPRHLGRGTVDGQPYFVMEYATPLPDELSHRDLVRILKRIAEACALLRDAGYYHCDIKPDNIGLIDGKAVLIDFGCVRRIARTTRRPARIGTEPFQAPEVADGKISEQSEIYSLGVTTRVLAKKSASLFRLALAIIPAKAKQPRKRFRSFEAFAAALDESEQSFTHLVRAYARLWRTIIIAVVGILAFAWISLTGLYLHRQAHVRETRKAVIAIQAHARAGLVLYDRRAYAAAVEHLEAAARHPDFDALGCQHERVYRILAECYRDGKGVAPDPAKSRYYRLKGR